MKIKLKKMQFVVDMLKSGRFLCCHRQIMHVRWCYIYALKNQNQCSNSLLNKKQKQYILKFTRNYVNKDILSGSGVLVGQHASEKTCKVQIKRLYCAVPEDVVNKRKRRDEKHEVAGQTHIEDSAACSRKCRFWSLYY